MLRIRAFVLCLALSLAPALSQAAHAATPTQQWIAVSDIHFNPLANPRLADRLIAEPVDRWRGIFAADGPETFSGYGHDTNDALFESALDAMHSAISEPAVVFITGDFLAHDFREKFDKVAKVHDDESYDAFVDKTMDFLAMEFRAAFPHARILPVIGNNDSYCVDYASAPRSPFLEHVAAAWEAAAPDPFAFANQFAIGGYYAEPLPAGNAEAIVLNDVFWSAHYTNACGDPHADPGADELAWLTQALKGAGDAPVWVVAHIPPGIDTYASLKANPVAPLPMLADRFNLPYVSALTGDAPHVVMALSAHTHMNGFRILGPHAGEQSVPMLVIPSVSPIFDGNPSFVVLDVDSSNAQVLDSRVIVLDNLAALAKDPDRDPQWRREYDFDSVYGDGPFDANHLWAVQDAIFGDERVRRRFETYHDGGSGRAPITDATWRAYWCGNVAMTATDFVACANPQIQTQLPAHPSPPPPPTPTPSPTPTASATPQPSATP